MYLNATSNLFLNTSRHSNSMTSQGSLFQCIMSLSDEEFLLTSTFKLPWHNMRPLLPILSLLLERRDWPTQPPYNYTVSPELLLLHSKWSQFPLQILRRLVTFQIFSSFWIWTFFLKVWSKNEEVTSLLILHSLESGEHTP